MPNRILKESICVSEEIDKLSWFEEVLFYRLIVKCDDFGRYDGREKIIKGQCFPLKDITAKDIDKALNKLSAVGLVERYIVSGHPYLQLVTWGDHQNIRNCKSKYPSPEEGCKQLNSIDINCNQLTANVPVIQSNPNPNPNPDIESEPAKADTDQIHEIVDYLNAKAHTNYRYSESTKKHIRARLKEKFTVEDFKAVIDKKCAEWLGDQKMQQYLRPDTLFGSKFETYLNAPAGSRRTGRQDVLPEYYNSDPDRAGSGEKMSESELAEFKDMMKRLEDR